MLPTLSNTTTRSGFKTPSKDWASTTHKIFAVDQSGKQQELWVAGEVPLTLKVDGFEIVRLMTLGNQPEALALGYLHNQGFIEKIEEKVSIRQSTIYALLREITRHNQVYRKAGSVHGCGLCQKSRLLIFAEDIGRHNAADAIAGRMWLDGIPGEDKILYTTGRLTSEIVLKTAQMRIPLLLSRSAITYMALEIARDFGLTVIGRAKGMRHLIYNGEERIIFDALEKKARN
jgi:FdhD protein